MPSEGRHYLEQELYELVRRDSSVFDFLQKGSLDGLWYWDLESPENEWMSPEFWTTLGFDPNEKKHLASEWQDLINPDDLKTALRNFEAHCADKNHPYHQIVRYKHRDGSTVWVQCRGIAIRNSDGQPIRMLGAHVNVTELKQSEEIAQKLTADLKSSRTEVEELRITKGLLNIYLKELGDFKTALDASAIVAITDPRGKITYVNNTFCEISGYSRNELIGKDHRIINSGHHSKEFIRGLWETIAAGKVWQGEIRNRAKNGTFYWVDTTIVPFVDEQGSPKQYVAIRSDITARKQAEEMLQKQAEELRRSNQDLEEFAYAASHDLQEPLRAVTGCLQILEQRHEGELTSDAKELIDHAINGAERMRNLIEDLLSFSRVGTSGEQFELVSCEEAVDEALNNLAAAVTESGASIVRDPLPELNGDKTQLTMLFQNLIGNAIKFRSEEPLEIRIRSEHVNNQTVISVHDNGIGIDSAHLDRVFVIFQRLHTRRKYPGTGIGLSLCRKIVERHGGSISVDSTPGKGSVFHCRFPY